MTIETVRVAVGTDDVHERDDTPEVVDNAIAVWANGENPTFSLDGGFRFDPVDVPQGATVNVGTFVTFTPNDVPANDDAGCTIYADDVDDSATWTVGAGTDVTGRTRTTASVAWSETALGAVASDTPDIASVIQEVIDRALWASGNALSIITIHDGSGNDLRLSPRDVDEANAPLLTVDYTAAGGSTKRYGLSLVGVG